jgi:hypothetical protein
MDIEWKENDWKLLTTYIRRKACTPFIGAGACAGILPSGRELAEQLGSEVNYPFSDPGSLPRVSQYYDMMNGRYLAHYSVMGALQQRLENHPPGKIKRIHEVLAKLPFHTYATTNYDDLLQRALTRLRETCQPQTLVCRWHDRTTPVVATIADGTHDRPVVFHLHGDLNSVQSMVLTEDDYLQFLCAVVEREDLIPVNIVRAFRTSALMFVGYSLEDISLRVLFQRVASFMAGNDFTHVAVQYTKPPNATAKDIESLEKHFDYQRKRLRNVNIRLFWGDCDEFAEMLWKYWEMPQTPRAPQQSVA